MTDPQDQPPPEDMTVNGKTDKRAKKMRRILARLERHGVKATETEWLLPHEHSMKEFPYGVVDLDQVAHLLDTWNEMTEGLITDLKTEGERAYAAESHLRKVGAWPIPDKAVQEAHSTADGDFFEEDEDPATLAAKFKEGVKGVTREPAVAGVFPPDAPLTFTAPVARLNTLGRCGRILSNRSHLHPFGGPKPLLGTSTPRELVGTLVKAYSDGDSIVWVRGEFDRTPAGFAHASALHLGAMYPGLDLGLGDIFHYLIPDSEEEVDRHDRCPREMISLLQDWKITGATMQLIGASSWDLPPARVDLFRST